MSLARQHRAHHEALRAAAASPAGEGGLAAIVPDPVLGTEQQLALARLTFDLRRLKEIQSLELKIVAKREMLPEYRDYVAGVLSAAEASGQAANDEVIAVLMVWSIDAGAFADALLLARHVLRFGVGLPARFVRTAGTLIAEQIAEAALEPKGGNPVPTFAELLEAEELTAGEDMPDEVRAQLKKALGMALVAHADALEEGESVAGERRCAQEQAKAYLARALELDGRVGAKKEIEKLERALRPAPTAPPARDAPKAPAKAKSSPPGARRRSPAKKAKGPTASRAAPHRRKPGGEPTSA